MGGSGVSQIENWAEGKASVGGEEGDRACDYVGWGHAIRVLKSFL